MRNLWGQIVGRLIVIENVIITIWALVCGAVNVADQQIRYLMRAGIIVLTIEFCLLAIGYILDFQGLIVLAAIIPAIVWLIGFKVISLGVNATATTIAGIPLIGARLSTLTEPLFCEVRKLLPPFITIAMAFSFIAVVIAIRGVGYYGLDEIMIFTSLALFLAIFASYIGKATKLPGWIMFIFVMYLFIGNYLLPIQVQGTMDWLEGVTIRRANSLSSDGMNGQLVVLPQNSPLYNLSFGSFRIARTSPSITTSVKVVGRKNDPQSKEGMLEVIMPVSEGVYVGGQSYFVPARITQPLPKPPELAAKVEERFETVNLSKGDIKSYKLAAYDGTPWINTHTGMNYNVHPVHGRAYRMYFSDGRKIDVYAGGKGVPLDYPGKFKVINISNIDETYIISGL